MGRKKLTNAERVRTLVLQGKSVKDIVAALRVTPQYVYSIRYKMNKDAGLAALHMPRHEVIKNKETGIVGTQGTHQISFDFEKLAKADDITHTKPKTFWQKFIGFFK